MTDAPKAIKPTCCKRQWKGYHLGSACGKPAKVERNGKHYCGIHDPARIEQRNAIKADAERARHARERAIAELLSAEHAERARRLALWDEMLAALRGSMRQMNDCMHNAQKGHVCFDGDYFHEALEATRAIIAKCENKEQK